MGWTVRWSHGQSAAPADLEDDALVTDVVECERMRAMIDARQVASFAELARRRVVAGPSLVNESTVATRERVVKWCAADFAPALRVAQVTAQHRLDTAIQLYNDFPAVWKALAAGVITTPKARIFLEMLEKLPADLAAEVIDATLPDAGDRTPGQLRKAIQRAIIAIDPQAAQDRHEEAKRQRRVQSSPADDSMAWMRAYLTADELASIMSILDAYAHSCPDDDPRSMDVRRADALLDLITGGSLGYIPPPQLPDNELPDNDTDNSNGASQPAADDTGVSAGGGTDDCGYEPSTSPATAAGSAFHQRPRKPGVDLRVVVGAGTLLGLDDKPAFLAGYGAIPASMARRLAKDSTWRRLLTDPSSTKLIEAGRARYRPSTALQEFIEARDVTCRWPGCRCAAQRCDKDHSIPFPDGCTCKENLLCLCRFHHRLKTHSDWKVRLDPDGTYTVLSPTGRVYVTEPPPPGEDVCPPTRNRRRGSIYLNDKDEPRVQPPPPEKPTTWPAEPPF
ncbi:HNH endonuclease signature motif containing protein [Fodinicola feengrottensis]